MGSSSSRVAPLPADDAGSGATPKSHARTSATAGAEGAGAAWAAADRQTGGNGAIGGQSGNSADAVGAGGAAAAGSSPEGTRSPTDTTDLRQRDAAAPTPGPLMLPAGVVTGAASDTSLGVGRVVGHLENQDAGWLTSGLADGAPSQVGPAGAHALQAGVDVLVGVCDGHGPEGLAVARRVVNTMPSLILQQLKRAEERAQDGAAEATALALSSAFVRMDAKLTRRQAAGGPSVDFSGTTCTAAVVSGRLLTVAWVGDSRAVLARRAAATGAATAASGSSHVAVDLTVDHTADLESERERIASHGGVVATAAEQVANTVPGGPLRVWVAGKQYPGLMTTRSLGDSVAHTVGCTALPETTSHELDGDDAYLIIASDGVFGVLSSQETVDIVAQHGSDCQAACKSVVAAALKGWRKKRSTDNIYVTVVALDSGSGRR